MRTRVQRWGNSLAVRIPKAVAAAASVDQNILVELTVADGVLMIRPVLDETVTLESLLAKITDDNLHGEVETGPRQGNEAW